MKLFIACFITLICFTVSLNAQEQETTTGQSLGLTAALQNSQMDIMMPIFLSNEVALAPSVGFSSVGDSFTDFALGLMGRFYINRSRVSPFLSARLGLLLASPKDGDSLTDIVMGLGGGGEYFISRYFSLGVEAQLNISKSDKNSGRFGNPGGTNVNTASAIFATVYF
ncbi:MAG TPA: hypothetical protein VHO03_08355 [Ignavibacteriales bacterium]|nr:hypothetical protein [Ignavibacteriales bacterium]